MKVDDLIRVYRDGLLQDTLPFWMPRSVDRECGGIFTALDCDGTVLSTDKPVWIQGRFAWMLATMYSIVEPKQLQDDIASVAFWYQTEPHAPFPKLPDRDYLEVR